MRFLYRSVRRLHVRYIIMLSQVFKHLKESKTQRGKFVKLHYYSAKLSQLLRTFIVFHPKVFGLLEERRNIIKKKRPEGLT